MLTDKEMIKILEEKLSTRLVEHSIGVAETAAQIASVKGLSVDKAKQAGFFHDYAKQLPAGQLLEAARNCYWNVDQLEMSLKKVLHAPAASFLLFYELGITDIEVLEAVRFHTIGNPRMSEIARILFLADKIEPGRKFPGLAEIRGLIDRDFNQALINLCNLSLEYNIKQFRQIHPDTLLFRNSLLKGE